jgi:hypothetical protein
MTTTTERPTTTRSAAATSHDPEPDAPAIDRIRYQQTLDQVEIGLDRVHQLLHRSRRAHATDRARRLSDLHAAVRAVGQLLNHAQGGWPPPPPDDEAP